MFLYCIPENIKNRVFLIFLGGIELEHLLKDQKVYDNDGALHPKSGVDRVYLSREMRGKGLINCEGCIRMEENDLRWYVRNSVKPLIEDVQATETIEYNDTVNKKKFKQSWMREKK